MRRVVFFTLLVLVGMFSCTVVKRGDIINKEFSYYSAQLGEFKFSFTENNFRYTTRGGSWYSLGTWELDSLENQIILKSSPPKFYNQNDSLISFQISNENKVEIIGKNKLRYKGLTYKSEN